MATGAPVLDRFLSSIAELVRNRDGVKLQDFLQLEPPLPDVYQQMIAELRQQFPPSSPQKDSDLQKQCEGLVPRSKGSSSWPAFPTFMKLYFSFLRDVKVENLLETYNMLNVLLKWVSSLSVSWCLESN